jgi:hypothetical protein
METVKLIGSCYKDDSWYPYVVYLRYKWSEFSGVSPWVV